jgi:hypothetical protein
MIEVFKTNVMHHRHATLLVETVQQAFPNYQANFDLEDCDKILRVRCDHAVVKAAEVIRLLKGFGFDSEVLPDMPANDDVHFSDSNGNSRSSLLTEKERPGFPFPCMKSRNPTR